MKESKEDIVKRVVKEHPDWDETRIKAEVYYQIAKQSPAFIDDSHVLPQELRDLDKER